MLWSHEREQMHATYCKQFHVIFLSFFANNFFLSLLQFSIFILIIILTEFGIGIYAMNNKSKEVLDGLIDNMTKIVKSVNGSSHKEAFDWVQNHVNFKIT